MSKKSVILSLFFLFSINLLPSISGDLGVLAGKVLGEQESKEEKQAQLEVGFENEEYLKKIGVKSIETDINLAEFDKTVFGGENLFYLGVGDFTNSGKEHYALTLAALTVEDGKNVVALVPYASESVVVNSEADADGKLKSSKNPIYGQKIRQLTLNDQNNPVAAFNRDDAATPNKEPQVCLVRSNGSSVITHKQAGAVDDIHDAKGGSASEIVGIASGAGKIFAAVTPNDKTDFGDDNSGFAVLVNKRSDDPNNPGERLSIINADDGTIDGNKALKLNLSADQMVAISQDAEIMGLGNMYWDSTLQRLFVGLVGVHKKSVASAAGAVSLLVGRVGDNGRLELESASRLTLDDFAEVNNGTNEDRNVFGFNLDANKGNWNTSIHNVKVMHTSTGFSYVILNGGGSQDSSDSKNKVYALPIVKSGDAQNVGKIADKNDANFSKVVDGANQLLDVSVADDKKLAFVGGGNLPLTLASEKVENMFVEGDSVFVCLSGDRSSDANEAGIFKSTALFDKNGKIFAWTKWQRVMGSTDKVFGGGLDRGLSANSGNYWYLTDKGAPAKKTIVKVTQWGQGEGSEKMLGQKLVPFLSNEFRYENAGVHQVFNFDEQTPGFNNFSIMIATGYKKVVLLETGKKDGGAFEPTSDFSDTDKYNVFDDGALDEIGPICCAEVSRNSGTGKKGWLFVGGYDGLVVLSKDDGDGWDAATGLNNITFTAFSFKKIGNFSHVRKLICSGDYLYIVTDKTIHRVEMNQGNFSIAGAPVVDGAQILDTAGLPDSGNNDFISDFMICNQLGLVSTISGLFKTLDVTDIANNPWQVVTTDIGPVQSFFFLSTERGGISTEGNLYVLAADFGFNLATVYRFQVVENDIHTIKEVDDRGYFYQVGEFRSNFLTDGVFGFHLLPLHFGKATFLKKINISSSVSSFRSSERIIDLDVEYELAYNVGLMIQNSATGAWVVPGDWGIRVQE